MKYSKSALVASISFIILFSLSLFLYSCGMSGPTSSSPNALPTTTIPQATASQAVQVILSASTTPTSITITIASATIKQYNLYVADSLSATVHNATKYTITSDNYQQSLVSDKSYKFFLTEIDDKNREVITGAYIISKPSKNNINRDDTVYNPPAMPTKYAIQNTNPQNPVAGALSGLTQSPMLNGWQNTGVYFSVYYKVVSEYGYSYGYRYSLHVVEPGGGHFAEDYSDADQVDKLIDFSTQNLPQMTYDQWINYLQSLRLRQHPETNWIWDNTSKRAYEQSLQGHWDDDDEKYTNSKSNGGTCTIGIMHFNYAFPGFIPPDYSFFGKPLVTYRINSCNNSVVIGPQAIPDSVSDPLTHYCLTNVQSVYINGETCTVGGTPPPPTNKKLAKIDITPDKLTTIYIHPKKPEAGKPDHGSQQYKAIGTYTDGTTDTIKDITSTGEAIWHSSKMEIAKINGNGLATPTTMPTFKIGTTDIQATSVTPPAPLDIKSNIAQLCVECWEYTHIRQNIFSPALGTDWTNQPYGASAFDIPVYRINPTTGQVIFINNRPVLKGYFPQPRTAADLPKYSIKNKGCHLTCAAMVLTMTTDKFINLYDLNDWLLKNNGYDTSNGPKWITIQEYFNSKIVSFTGELVMVKTHVDTKTKQTITDRTREQSLALIDNALQDCSKIVVLTVSADPNIYTPPFLERHYVLALKGEQGQYKIYDPWIFQNEGDKPIQVDDVGKRYNITHFNIITIQK